MKQYSEDPGSQSGEPYTVKRRRQFVPEFKNLALRLKENEVGIVKTKFGYHVIERVPPPPPDPLESADILARPRRDGTVHVQHVLIGWKDAPAAQRPDARRRAPRPTPTSSPTRSSRRPRAAATWRQLMKEFSEDPGSKDNARVYDVSPDAPMVEPFKKLSLRLKDGRGRHWSSRRSAGT